MTSENVVNTAVPVGVGLTHDRKSTLWPTPFTVTAQVGANAYLQSLKNHILDALERRPYIISMSGCDGDRLGCPPMSFVIP